MTNEKEIPAEKPAEKKAPASAPKTWKYVGPTTPRAPVIGNLPGSSQAWRADQLPQQYVPFVLDTVPHAAGWWVYE